MGNVDGVFEDCTETERGDYDNCSLKGQCTAESIDNSVLLQECLGASYHSRYDLALLLASPL